MVSQHIIAKFLLLAVLTSFSLQVEGCVDGKCTQCSLSREQKASCQQCYYSITKTINNDMEECQGSLPIKNCRYGIEKMVDGKKVFLCEGCELRFMPADDYKSCVPTTVNKCLETLTIGMSDKSFKRVCLSCEPGYVVSKDGLKCDKATESIKNCLVYGSIRYDRV